MTNAIAAPKLYAAVKGRALPSSVVKEILMGLTVGLCVGGVWKVRRRTTRRAHVRRKKEKHGKNRTIRGDTNVEKGPRWKNPKADQPGRNDEKRLEWEERRN